MLQVPALWSWPCRVLWHLSLPQLSQGNDSFVMSSFSQTPLWAQPLQSLCVSQHSVLYQIPSQTPKSPGDLPLIERKKSNFFHLNQLKPPTLWRSLTFSLTSKHHLGFPTKWNYHTLLPTRTGLSSLQPWLMLFLPGMTPSLPLIVSTSSLSSRPSQSRGLCHEPVSTWAKLSI